MFKKITLGFAFLAAALLSTAPVYSQSANLIEAGKKEGKAVDLWFAGIRFGGNGF